MTIQFEMPYNNTPIAPSQETTGQVSLPLARVKKIINADPTTAHCSAAASFTIALATEMFIQHLATTTHNVVKAERKPRRNIQYRDVAAAVAKTDNLEFLVDVVPKTMTYKEFKKRREEKGMPKGPGLEKLNGAAGGATNGDGVVNGVDELENGNTNLMEDERTNGDDGDEERTEVDTPVDEEDEPEAMEVDGEEGGETQEGEADEEQQEEQGGEEEEEEDPAAMQLAMEMSRRRTSRLSGGSNR